MSIQGTGAPVAVEAERDSGDEAVEDFERYCAKEAWEKAFAALGKAYDQAAGGLIPDKDGFMVPISGKLRDELLSLPAPGREADCGKSAGRYRP